ncbi:hypothetical protein WMY93_015887 [Mugilogobius chulae]|uniref:Ig-like domain-containing protein n=1 Tax=Mugilogobius chulae TaxID=88201 RepID=A0AAW0P2L0_9GOBI
MSPLVVLLLLLLLRFKHCAADYIIEHDCWKPVCFQSWRPGNINMAIVTNGQIQADSTQAEESKCKEPLNSQGSFCGPCEAGQNCAPFSSVINTYPGRNVTLQCALLSSLLTSSCSVHPFGRLAVKWVDDNDNPFQDDAEYRITTNSPCDVTLTLSLKSPKNATFRCSARISGLTVTSKKIEVKMQSLKGRGRGLIIPEPQPEGGADGDGEVQPGSSSSSVVAPTVGVVCAAAVIVAAAVFVLNKRRTNSRRPMESPTSTAEYMLDPDEVIYADVIHPVSSQRQSVSVYEPTVYASVRCS